MLLKNSVLKNKKWFCGKAIMGLLLFCISASSFGQETAAWAHLSYKQQVSEKWGYAADFQLRSGTSLKGIKTLLARAWASYYITDSKSVGLGYTHFGNWNKEQNRTVYNAEHRIFEEFQLKNKLGKVGLTNRLRLEQRFLDVEHKTEFSQRLRYLLGFNIPLSAVKVFNRPTSIVVQDELFLNVQNKNATNGKFFDQNRPYVGWSVLYNDHLKAEIGYYFRTHIQFPNETVNMNIFQLKLSADF
ncbi:DUF2490 domain-containing protein [Flavobacterium agricola]|uniref:DUF2490 domain-containing protein n=1 Tax=Flavobacterium agricola TaxID=2870839 RepID=A0ABY6M4V1_9FLAO|nr:DUF2490 domain-containing protein [Flavobacterium agricola]UYW02481.1 DUF2490 domain-containing protein [Flavobacterium agricola]